ncbi:Tyrosine-protein phosphatase pmp1 [Termitomyces sp. T112]|nr:Tyrosine-protein phosphatase pmp1 [Termitomyces sp. T112]
MPAFLPSDDDPSIKSLRTLNMKKLSLTLPSAPRPTRRPSVMSLPPTANALIHRKEDLDDLAPYADGPIEIIPGIWLGSEDNARDWKGLIERGIKSILNVAKEVSCPLDPDHSLRPVSSTPDFKKQHKPDSTYHPPNIVTGRPGMHYLKLQWSHGQQDLVHVGFQAAMAFTDAALARREGILIHCQCGISRSATMVVALVMRAAADQSPSVPTEVWALKGMQGAYSYVKEKSKWIGPNMSLIYQLLEYEKKLKQEAASPSASEKSSLIDEEEEWGRQRKLLDELPSDDEPENTFVLREAQALDKAMEERVVARQSSASSLASSSNSRVGMGTVWRTRYANQRKRTGSIASNATCCSSRLSEDLVEEEEEEELLGVGGGFEGRLSADPSDSSASPDDEEEEATPPRASVFKTARPKAPVWKTSFSLSPPPATTFKSTFTLPPPPTATRSSFNIPPPPPASSARSIPPPPRGKRRPVPIGILPPVPSSPIAIVVESTPSETPVQSIRPNNISTPRTPALALPPVRVRTTSSILPPPLHLRNHLPTKTTTAPASDISTPSQTLFVFPPSPTTLTSRTPSTMTLTSNMGGNGPVPFPTFSIPRVSTFRSQSRTRSFIGLGAPPAPTIRFSKVDARGYFGLE